jgi:hypothetical protein
MNDNTTLRMMIATAALAAVAALFAGGANAKMLDEGGSGGGASAVPATQPPTIPYLSHGIGVDASQFSGQASPKPTGVHAALARDREPAASSTAERQTIPYLSHGIGVDAAQFSGQASLGLTGDSPLTRVSAPEPEGLTGDSPLTRYPGTVSLPATSGGSDTDWTWFGVGAGMAALLAAGLAGVLLSTRHRNRVALP